MKRRIYAEILLALSAFTVVAASQTDQASQSVSRSANCSMRVSSQPSGARVYLDSLFVGTTPLEVNHLRQKEYSLILASPKYERWQTTVTAVPEAQAVIEAVLSVKKTILAIEAAPEDARIFIDDRLVPGSGAGSIAISPGEHKVEVRSDSLQRSISRSYSVFLGDNLSVQARLGFRSTTAAGLSMLIPGSGQMRDGAILTGMAYLAGTAGLLLVGLKQTNDYQAALNTYKTTRDQYSHAHTEAEIIRARTLMNGAKQSADKAYRNRNIAYSAFIGFYLLNVVDALLFHSVDDEMKIMSDDDESEASIVISPQPHTVSCGIALKF